jgi:hypothetical protein
MKISVISPRELQDNGINATVKTQLMSTTSKKRNAKTQMKFSIAKTLDPSRLDLNLNMQFSLHSPKLLSLILLKYGNILVVKV